MNQVKIERVNSLLEKEISTILMMEVKDPDIRFVTVTKVNTTNDLSYAKVYVTVLKDDKKEETLKALKGNISTIIPGSYMFQNYNLYMMILLLMVKK